MPIDEVLNFSVRCTFNGRLDRRTQWITPTNEENEEERRTFSRLDRKNDGISRKIIWWIMMQRIRRRRMKRERQRRIDHLILLFFLSSINIYLTKHKFVISSVFRAHLFFRIFSLSLFLFRIPWPRPDVQWWKKSSILSFFSGGLFFQQIERTTGGETHFDIHVNIFVRQQIKEILDASWIGLSVVFLFT